MTESNRRLFFLHLPKCAGTSFKDVLYRNFPLASLCWIDGNFHEVSTQKLLNLEPSLRDRYACIAGHYQYGLHRHFCGGGVYVTFLREPVQRVLSMYYHIKNAAYHPLKERIDFAEVSLLEFVNSDYDEIDNIQTRWICGQNSEPSVETALERISEHFVAAGISELFDESLIYLQDQIPRLRNLLYVPRNIGKQPNAKHLITEAVLDTIRARNSLDILLYSEVFESLQNKIARHDIAKRISHQKERVQAHIQHHNRFSMLYRIQRSIQMRRLHQLNRIDVPEEYIKRDLPTKR